MISRLAGWWRTHRSATLVVGAVAGAVVIAVALVWPITDLIAAHDVGRIAGPHRATELQTAREAVRTQLLTLAAGVFVAGALWFTAQNFRLSREGQVTDRYTKAIEQLGSDKLEVRIGGIYALERVARDSARDHSTVIDVLAAFVRESPRDQWTAAEPDAESPRRTTRPDTQAAVTVIGRRIRTHDRARVELGATDLAGMQLNGLNFAFAILAAANLRGASLAGANLEGAVLMVAKLNDAYLPRADLTRAVLMHADLTGADLTAANLISADLTSANLTSTNLTDADLTDALLGESQPVPGGWLRNPDSGRLRRPDPATENT